MDEFSDDGFDELNDTTLQELENNAIQLTQAAHNSFVPTQAWNQPDDDNDDYGLEVDDLDDTVVIDEAAQLPVRHPIERQPQAPGHVLGAQPAAASSSTQHAPSRALPNRSIPQPRWQQAAVGTNPPSQYQQSARTLSASNRPPVQQSQRMGTSMGPPRQVAQDRYSSHPTNSQYMRPPPPPPSSSRPLYQPSQGQPQPQYQSNILEALQARVRALENDLNSARGEASIVRAKHDKFVAAHEAEITRLKKQNAEALSKQDRIVEAAVHAEKAAAAELQFTRQDLREELQRSKKQRKESAETGTSTPKKNKGGGWKNIADGFDDVEILSSPSRTQGAAKGKGKAATGGPGERTPSRAKRKRPVLESPVTALEVEGDVLMADAESPAPIIQLEPAASILRPSALPYDLLRLVLDHGSIHGQPLTFDLLARYSFPSDPDQSFAGIIFQKLPSLGDPHDPIRLLIDFCDMLIDLWDQCLREKYYEPIYDLVALTTFILQLNTISVAPYITSTLIPIAHTTIYLLAVPRFESQDGDLSNSTDETISHLVLNIDTEGTLQLMYLAALGCVDSYLLDPENPLNLGPARDPPQRLYWKLMQIDFVLAMLSPKQPREEFLGMLSLLCTSCLPESIGPITSEPERDPEFVAQALVERVSKMMHMPQQWATPGDTSGSFGHRQCIVRLAALRTLMSFAQSPMGAKQLALSEVAIPRLVNVLCGALDALYDMDVPVDLFRVASHETAQAKADLSREDPPGDAEEMQGVVKESDENSPNLPPTGEHGLLDINPTPLLYSLISSTILLLHTLVTDPATSAFTDMRAKLSTSHGASQKYLLTLSRLNYAEEDLVLEAGIDPSTFDLANDLLDLAITPDEAEGIREVFGG